MIDHRVFRSEWRALCGRFNRPVNREEARRYYEWLKDRLSTDEFRQAMEEVYAHSEFFPRPAAFVEAVRGKPSGPWVAPLPPEVKLLPPGPDDSMTREERRALFDKHLPGWSDWVRKRRPPGPPDAKPQDEQRAALKKRMEEA